MKTRIAVLVAIVFCSVHSAHALYAVYDHGAWPESWPKELEPLRKQSRTRVGPKALNRHYQIPFTKREEFEAAWPHLLNVKSKGAPIFLVRGPKTDFFEIKPAGVLIHSPPTGTEPKEGETGALIPAQTNPRTTWMNNTFFELVVDGIIVDLNRITLPADTPIIDWRFKADDVKLPERKAK